MSVLYVGVSPGRDHLDVCLLPIAGTEQKERMPLPRSPECVRAVAEQIARAAANHRANSVLIGIEISGLRDYSLWTALTEENRLQGYAPTLYRFHPRHVDNIVQRQSTSDEGEPARAFSIAEELREGRLPVPIPADDQVMAIQRLTRQRIALMEALASEKIHFLCALFAEMPESAALHALLPRIGAPPPVFAHVLSADALASTSLIDSRLVLPTALRERILTDPRITLQLQYTGREGEGVRGEGNPGLMNLQGNIDCFRQQIELVDRRLTGMTPPLPGMESLMSIDGMEPVFVNGMLAEIQSIDRFESDSALAGYAGLVWNAQDIKSEDRRGPARAGNTYLRHYLLQAANSLRQNNEEYRAFYQSKNRTEDPAQHPRACTLTARKLVQLVYILLKTGQPYRRPNLREQRHFARRPQEEILASGPDMRIAV